MKNKRLAERKRMKSLKSKMVLQECILSRKANETLDDEILKFNNETEDLWIDNIFELFKKGKIGVKDITGYIFKKVNGHGKVVERYAISKSDVEKYYDLKEINGETLLLDKKKEQDENEVYDLLTSKFSFKHRMMDGKIQEVKFKSRNKVLLDEFNSTSDEDGLYEFMESNVLALSVNIGELYGENIPNLVSETMQFLGMDIDESRTNKVRNKFTMDSNIKMMMLSMFK